jgi:hypothetical protein
MKQRKQFEQQIIGKAMKDPDFRKKLVEDPKTAFEEETGMMIPEGITVNVMEEEPGTVYLVLPFVYRESTEGELTVKDLEMVSGGNKWTFEGCGPDDGSTYY